MADGVGVAERPKEAPVHASTTARYTGYGRVADSTPERPNKTKPKSSLCVLFYVLLRSEIKEE
ncbi:MAG: hypothetical protein PF444_01780 [Bacteroidales bacterium]|jgi:hypothetical protein|nr:hypothetical protein [Bacteroidales bacterium]